MAILFIEPRPKGRPEGTAINDYAVEEAGGRVLHEARTQRAAIDWAKANGHSARVARVRNTDKGNPDHWRSAD